MMDDPQQLDEPLIDGNEVGLDDRSDELTERSEADARVDFYRAMADTEADYDRLLGKLPKAVAEVIFDFCVLYLVDESDGSLRSPAAYHPHPQISQSLHRAFASSDQALGDGLVNRVISQEASYFRPRWRSSLLTPYTDGEETPELGIDIHSLMAVPMTTTDGECLGALLVGRHNTSRSYDERDLALTEWIASHAAMKLETARLYRDLRETNRRLDAAVQARDTFISIASHQLRTPLSTLKLHAQMLRRQADNQEAIACEEVIPKLDSIDHQVDYVDRLVDQLVDVSQLIEGGLQVNWQRCDLAKVVAEVETRFSYAAEKAGSSFNVDTEQKLVGLWDRDRLDHVITNLVSNAIKYGGGNPIRIETRREGDQAVVCVADRGRGIPKDCREAIFERFERAADDESGLGIGLWIVSEYVDSLDGTVCVESTVGEGSTFTVRLPLSPPSAPM